MTLNINKFSQYISDNDKVSAYNILDKDFAIKNNITIDNIIDIYENEDTTRIELEFYEVVDGDTAKFNLI